MKNPLFTPLAFILTLLLLVADPPGANAKPKRRGQQTRWNTPQARQPQGTPRPGGGIQINVQAPPPPVNNGNVFDQRNAGFNLGNAMQNMFNSGFQKVATPGGVHTLPGPDPDAYLNEMRRSIDELTRFPKGDLTGDLGTADFLLRQAQSTLNKKANINTKHYEDSKNTMRQVDTHWNRLSNARAKMEEHVARMRTHQQKHGK